MFKFMRKFYSIYIKRLNSLNPHLKLQIKPEFKLLRRIRRFKIHKDFFKFYKKIINTYDKTLNSCVKKFSFYKKGFKFFNIKKFKVFIKQDRFN